MSRTFIAAALSLGIAACQSEWKLDTSVPLPTCSYHIDGDEDGFGDPEETLMGYCSHAPPGAVDNGLDCDDRDAGINPEAAESCNGLDDDCDGAIDEEVDQPWYQDADGDGHGDPQASTNSCDAPNGWVAIGDDCDDRDPTIHPDAVERCNGYDDDCDEAVDDEDADVADQQRWYLDADGDGYGIDGGSVQACERPDGHAAADGDCDDSDPRYHPGASEDDCSDPNDYNCDGSVSWADRDGDGWAACEDCDDGDASVNPDALERCDSIDNDCDGSIDGDGAVDADTWYADADGDGFGDAASTATACSAPTGYLSDDSDCDDSQAGTHPGATEYCNGVDDDCDGDTDEDSAVDAGTWYADADGDSYGDPGAPSAACSAPSGSVGDASDCDDSDADINPGALELCNGVDDDCDGSTDEDSAVDAGTWYLDADGDGYGDAASPTTACSAPSGSVGDASDCDDSDGGTHPDADERCDGTDNDCDGSVDEDSAVDADSWHLDADGDGYGHASDTVAACAAPTGYVTVTGAADTDCDDDDGDVYPGAPERCNGIDDDCDGALGADEADADGDGYDVCGDGDCDDSSPGIGPDGDTDGDGQVDCWDDDDDDDGVYDEDELDGSYSGFVTDPLDPDTDHDGADDDLDPAPLTAACQTTLYFYDDFVDDPASSWADISGSWSWDGYGTFANTSTTAGANTWIGARSWTDYVVEVVMRPDHSSNDPGFMTRVQAVSASNDHGESYYVGLYPSSDQVVLGYQDGGWNVVRSASVTIDSGVWYTLQHRMAGSDHEVWLDGSLIISDSDSSYAWGSIGLRTYRSPASYDYILVCN